MPDLGQYSCWVEVDGVKLSEYSLEYSADGVEAICWIPSEVDKKFSIHWVDSKASCTRRTYGFMTVDGIDCGGKELSLVRTGIRWVGTGHWDSVDTSSMTRRPLLFGRQRLTDDDRFLDALVSPDLGTITLKLVDGLERRTLPQFRQFVTLPSQKLHERSKKAIGHSVHFGAAFRSHALCGQCFNCNVQDTTVEVLECLAKFTFKYRPLDLLKANGIVRADKLRPGPAIEVPDDEDEEAIASKIKALQDKLAAVRRKTRRASNKIKKETKAETSFFFTRGGDRFDIMILISR